MSTTTTYTGEQAPGVCQHCGEVDLPICCTESTYEDGSADDAECVACCTRSHTHTHPAWGTRTPIRRATNPLDAWEAVQP